jgi:hypothetical protein
MVAARKELPAGVCASEPRPQEAVFSRRTTLVFLAAAPTRFVAADLFGSCGTWPDTGTGYRKIQLTVTKNGLIVQTREGYYA